jgi:hypothetical protein
VGVLNAALFPSFKQGPAYSKGLVLVPHQVRNTDRPTVSTSLAATLTPTVSRGLLSLKIWTRNYIAVSVFIFFSPVIHSRMHLPRGRMTYTRSSSGSKNQTTEVSGTLVAQGSGSIDESTDTVALQGRADKGGAPGGDGVGGLLGLDELLLGVGELGTVIGRAEEGAQDGELDAVVEEGAQRDGGGLNGGEVCRAFCEPSCFISFMRR